MANKILLIFILSLGLASMAFADQAPPILSKVNFQLTAEKWLSTDSAKVYVSVDAILPAAGMPALRNEINQGLKKIADGDWHITTFNRSQTAAGVENVSAMAEVRLKENQLNNLHEIAQQISKTGLQFKIQNIDYSPTLTEIEKTKAALRDEIYQQASSEVSHLNQIYPNEKFMIYDISFNSVPEPVLPQAMMMARTLVTGGTQAAGESMQVSQQLYVNASVTVAAIHK